MAKQPPGKAKKENSNNPVDDRYIPSLHDVGCSFKESDPMTCGTLAIHREKRERRLANAKARETALKYVWPAFIIAFVLMLVFVAVYANRGGFTPTQPKYEKTLLSEETIYHDIPSDIPVDNEDTITEEF
eukprot:1175582-Prorocentrum_minimum.AAC.3